MIPLISFDVVVNVRRISDKFFELELTDSFKVYLTMLFLVPLRGASFPSFGRLTATLLSLTIVPQDSTPTNTTPISP